jgi:hypothetical protein
LRVVVILEAVAIGLLGLLVAGLLRSHAEILRRLHHLGAGLDLGPAGSGGGAQPVVLGTRPPTTGLATARISGSSPDGDAVSVALDRPDEQTLLLFLSSGCGTCGPWWDGLRAGAHRGAIAGGRVVVVARDADEESPSLLRGLAPAEIPVVLSSAAWDAFAVPGSPYVVLVDGSAGRVVGEGVARSWEQLDSLVGQHRGDVAARVGTVDRSRRTGRMTDTDEELLAAGLVPGHPSLHPAPGSWTRPDR